MITEEHLRQLSQDERRELARILARIDLPHPLLDRGNARRRRFGLLVAMGACLFLAGWIAILAITLPLHYTSTHWRGAWVGLDVAELAGFAATAWAAWYQRQVLIFFLVFTGTLLICDAWFDVALDYGTADARMSALSLLGELPLAFFLLSAARRLARITVHSVMRLEGIEGPVPSLFRVPLFADGLEEALPARFRGGLRDRDKEPSQTGG